MKIIKNREKEKEQAKDLKQKLMLFDRLPEQCVVCREPFDKLNKDQVLTWTVVVRKEQEVVNLYCPDCIKKAKDIIKSFEAKKKEENEPNREA